MRPMVRNDGSLPAMIPLTPMAVFTEPIVDGDLATDQYKAGSKRPEARNVRDYQSSS